jgi:hypothetical protein
MATPYSCGDHSTAWHCWQQVKHALLQARFAEGICYNPRQAVDIGVILVYA